MGDALRRRLMQDRFDGPAHEAVLNLLLAAGRIQEDAARTLSDHGLSLVQYNVLRILKGAHPDGYARCELARRMIERAPDLTRLVDRLERRGLVERGRSGEDRRRSIARITRKGLDLVERIAPAAASLHGGLSRRLTASEVGTLSRLCEKLHAAP